MGADGPGLFSDDTACDVRDAYQDALEDGLSDIKAEHLVRHAFAEELGDPDEQVVVVLALAVTQSKLGRLSAEVRSHALALLDAGGDLHQWQDAGPRLVRQRAAALLKARQQIEGPQPVRRRVRQRAAPRASLEVGQVLGYRGTSGLVHLMRVAALSVDRCGATPTIHLLAYGEPDVPHADVVATLPDRVRRPPWKRVQLAIVDDNPARRAELGIFPAGWSAQPPAPVTAKAASDWAALLAYLDSRDQLRGQDRTVPRMYPAERHRRVDEHE